MERLHVIIAGILSYFARVPQCQSGEFFIHVQMRILIKSGLFSHVNMNKLSIDFDQHRKYIEKVLIIHRSIQGNNSKIFNGVIPRYKDILNLDYNSDTSVGFSTLFKISKEFSGIADIDIKDIFTF